jgi:DNA-binding transcriptional regulator LsrR (DeoR family)
MTHERLLAKIAHNYYIEEMSQREIADSLALSYAKVSRMLAEAKRLGLVQVNIKYPVDTNQQLEAEMEKRFGLREAIIVKSSSGNRLRVMGQAGADALQRVATPKDVIGISWGASLLNLVNQLPSGQKEGAEIVQLVGGLNGGGQNIQAVELAKRLGQIYNSDPSILYCPAVVANPMVKAGLMEDESITHVMKLWNKVTISLIGIGSMSRESVLFKEHHLSEQWFTYLQEKGAVGDMCMRFFDKDGQAFSSDLDDVLMGVDLPSMSNMKTVICVAGGVEKAEAIAGALHTGIPDILVTDLETAREVLSFA